MAVQPVQLERVKPRASKLWAVYWDVVFSYLIATKVVQIHNLFIFIFNHLAFYCIVNKGCFLISGMDAGSMRRILSGLAQAGAWGCFDEFNRLEESTMSAVSMLIRPLQEAVRDGMTAANLGGLEIPVDQHCCLFITMNPAGDDYGGRRKLPDSLARLFRPIGMAHPNKKNIVRSLLECAGFRNAGPLASQLVESFDTAEKLLSKQPHYDWGLRALRSVLSAIPSAVGVNSQMDENSR